jgi:hypothetical protein
LFSRLSVAEGSARYNGPAGVQAVALGELFSVLIEEERDLSLAPGDVLQVGEGARSFFLFCLVFSLQAVVRWQPKPAAFVQFTDWEGHYSCRLVATWSTPGVRGHVMSWLDLSFKAPFLLFPFFLLLTYLSGSAEQRPAGAVRVSSACAGARGVQCGGGSEQHIRQPVVPGLTCREQ